MATPVPGRYAANAAGLALQRSLGNRVAAQLLRDELARDPPPRPGLIVQRVTARTPDEHALLRQLQQQINSVYGPSTRSRARYDTQRWVDELADALAPKLQSWTEVKQLTEGLAGKSPSAARAVIDLLLREPVSEADPRAATELGGDRDEEREKESEGGSVARGLEASAATTAPGEDRGGPDEPARPGRAPLSRSSQARLHAFEFIRQAVDLIVQLSHIERSGWPDADTPVRIVVWELRRRQRGRIGIHRRRRDVDALRRT